MKLTYTDEAIADLLDAITYLQERSPLAARKLDAAITECIDRLAMGEFEGPPSLLRSGASVRSWPVSAFRIYYQRLPDELLIVRIYHQARLPITRRTRRRYK